MDGHAEVNECKWTKHQLQDMKGSGLRDRSNGVTRNLKIDGRKETRITDS
jgi:hypothetical protein